MGNQEEWWRPLVEQHRLDDPLRARRLEDQYRRADKAREKREARRIDDVFSRAQIEMDACEFRAGSVRGLTEGECQALRVCYRCGEPLQGAKRKWCSRACEEAWWTNHAWAWASSAVRQRDDHTCVRCGRHRGDVIDPGYCRQDGHAWPCPDAERMGPTAYTWPHYRIGTRAVEIEVNHREPLVGRGYHAGCVHHQDGLEVLCHECHVEETNRQAAERRAAALRGQYGRRATDVQQLELVVG